MKKLLFHSQIVSASLSGMEVSVLSKNNFGQTSNVQAAGHGQMGDIRQQRHQSYVATLAARDRDDLTAHQVLSKLDFASRSSQPTLDGNVWNF